MRKRRTTATAIGGALALLALTACGDGGPEGPPAANPGQEQLMHGTASGAGASFPAPLFDSWIEDFIWYQPFASMSYRSIGSGGGIESFLAQEADFGSSEKYLTDEELATARQVRGCAAVQFPVIFGSVVIAFNDPRMDGLILDAEAIAGIYDRRITRYDDPELAALNPEVDLPDQEITPVHRSDSSGTTYVFTHYLSHEVPLWDQRYGEGGEIEWAPGSVAGEGNEQVTARVIETEGSLGYVNQSYALRHDLATARVVNADGVPIAPTLEATTAASEEAEIPEGFQFDIDDVGGEGYPITGTNWIMVYSCGYDQETTRLLRSFWNWALTSPDADELALELGYAPMGGELKRRVQKEIVRISNR